MGVEQSNVEEMKKKKKKQLPFIFRAVRKKVKGKKPPTVNFLKNTKNQLSIVHSN